MHDEKMAQRILRNTYMSDLDSYNGTPCWNWTGRRDGTGRYGRMNIRINGRHTTLASHRAALYAFKGFDLGSPLVVLHLCNNTLCCAPLHLQAGTQSQNIRQCIAEGRHNNFGRTA